MIKQKTDEAFEKLHVYSLTGYTPDGLSDEVFLVHDEKFGANQFQTMVITIIGKLQQEEDLDKLTIHEVAQKLQQKFGFKRYSLLNCVVWDKSRKLLCEASIRG